MKILNIDIEKWRNFENVSIQIPEEETLVCLVGENGTGKSNILELISVASAGLGLSSGFELQRGNPLNEPHSFSVKLKLSDEVREFILSRIEESIELLFKGWDGTIEYISQKSENENVQTEIKAGGNLSEGAERSVGSQVKNKLREIQEIYHVYLDADRAYPPVKINSRQIVEAERKEFETWEWKNQWAHKPTRALYEEWIKYFLAKERQNATNFAQKARSALEKGEDQPLFEDPFEDYKKSLKDVLPHLIFSGIDDNQQTISYDSAGTSLKFWQLSSGEREISFLIGQIERFQLRQGIFLLDEPELHLTPDLVRLWVSYLKNTVEVGQVWVATHSLEAVEVAGKAATFVFERDEDSRIVKEVNPLGERPIIDLLSSAIGSPAFSISKLRFILIEGDRQNNERERFYSLCGKPTINRFLEVGSCNEVLRKIEILRELSTETDERLRLGAVIDRDFRSDAEVEKLEKEINVHVTECHEIENLYLQPEAIQKVLDQNGTNETTQDVLKEASDRFAGRWILSKSMMNIRDINSDDSRELRKIAGSVTFETIETGVEDFIDSIIEELSDYDEDLTLELRGNLKQSFDDYSAIRNRDDLWRQCFGKEVLGTIPEKVGLRDQTVYMRTVDQLWKKEEIDRSNELISLRDYVNGIVVT